MFQLVRKMTRCCLCIYSVNYHRLLGDGNGSSPGYSLQHRLIILPKPARMMRCLAPRAPSYHQFCLKHSNHIPAHVPAPHSCQSEGAAIPGTWHIDHRLFARVVNVQAFEASNCSFDCSAQKSGSPMRPEEMEKNLRKRQLRREAAASQFFCLGQHKSARLGAPPLARSFVSLFSRCSFKASRSGLRLGFEDEL